MKQPRLGDLLRIMVKEQASDLILKVGGCPAMRVAGVIHFLGDEPITHDLLNSYLGEVLNEHRRQEFHQIGATDTAIAVPGVGRFRCNVFHQCGQAGFVFRSVKSEIPSFKELNLPVDRLKRLSSLKRGLVISDDHDIDEAWGRQHCEVQLWIVFEYFLGPDLCIGLGDHHAA